jgi:PAS domain S-box-containing protein
MRGTYVKKRGIALYSYLYAQTIALAIFALSRSIGHIVKRVLITAGYPEVWEILSPVSGSINSLTFVGFGLIALLYSNVRATSEKVDALEKKERELRESEEKYRTLVEDIPDMIYSLNDKGEFISINTTGLNLLGYSKEEIIGAHFSKVVFKEDHDKAAKSFKELLEHKRDTTRGLELRLQAKKGDIIYTELNARARYGEDGRLIRTEGVVRDITERKQGEEQILRQSAVLDAINKVFQETLSCETDEEVARMCLAVAEELTGSKFGLIGEVNESGRFDVIALSDPGWEACRMPKSDAVIMIKDMEVRGIWGGVLRDGRSLMVNDPASHPDRVGIPEDHPPLTSFLGVPLKREGKTTGMIALANKEGGYDLADQEDIETLSAAFLEALIRKRAEEALQESEKFFSGTLNDMLTFVAVLEPDGKVIFVNNTPLDVAGITLDDVKGKMFYDAFWWQYSEEARQQIKEDIEICATGETLVHEIELQTVEGGLIWIEYSMHPIYDEDGKIKYLVPEGRDISDRKRAEEALRKSEASLAEAQRIAHMGNWDWNIKTNQLRWSDEIYRIFGLAPQEFGATYEAFLNSVHPDDREFVKKSVDKTLSEGKPYSIDHRIVRPDGSERIVHEEAEVFFDENGEAIRMIGTVQDITERKRVEDRIQHLHRVLEAIRNINQLIISEKDLQKLLQGTCEILSQTRDYRLVWIGLVQEGVKDVLPAAQTDFEEGYLESVKITWDDSETGKGPTGTAIKIGKPVVMRDIASDPRYKPWREEAMKRGYASSAAVPLVYDDKVFGALNVYAALSDAFDEEEIGLLVEVGQDIAFALHNIEVEEERKQAEEALQKAHDELELRVRERTAELEEANIKLQELDRLKSMFIASMSHELRTPLNSIIGFTGIILQGMTGEITEEQRKQLTMVKSSANHLLDLINDIIDLSKIEAGKVELAIEEFDLSTIVQEVKDSFTVAVAEKGLKMPLKMPDRLVIESDERRVKQVLVNLVGNAVKFTDEGEIEIKAARMDGMVEVSVSDTGIGIRKEDMDRLFKPFSQVPSEDRAKEGTGLGLYLSKKIAELLGGEIKAESELGKGSVFTFTLPLKYREVKT